uniref:Prohead serine protease n=1 Tax=Siphoviridae sp. ctXfh4 TaxID=2827887 RepID=A0A8S5SF79_9CAUD|nr:MAG TPA: prohead serine protease [Siphoviridae sp. ctXfh4]
MRKDNNIEIRATNSTPVVSQDSRTVEGYAVVFNSQSEDLGFYETINPAAITEEVLKRSDVFCLFNHDQDKVLARSKYGTGSLQLQLDEQGLKYTFTAPNTDLGDELLEYLKRGDIDSSSFAFTVSTDEGSEVWTTGTDGRQYREILKIDSLHDVSPVWTPAYSSTSVSQRTLDKLNQLREMQDEKEKEVQEETVEKTDEVQKDEVPTQEEVEETVEKSDDEVVDEDKDKDNDVEGEDKEEDKETRSATQKHININTRKMEQNYSLLGAIRNISEGRRLDPIAEKVNEIGKSEMRRASLNSIGQLYVPFEKRAAVSVTAEGNDIVGTNLMAIEPALRAKNVLVQSGAKFMTGLSGNVQIPRLSPSNVGWQNEVGQAVDGAPTFDNVTLTPHRLTCYVDLSKQLLVQDSLSVEEAIRQDIIAAITSKLEATILSADARTVSNPGGLMAGKTPTAVATFADICRLEAAVESAGVLNPVSYVVSPSVRANFRDMTKGKGMQLAYVDNSLDGATVLSTGNMKDKHFIVADWTNLALAQFGSLDITVDSYSQAVNGCVRLVINSYWDCQAIRPEAFQFGKFA